MFELWREDGSGVRLDAQTQVSAYLGSIALSAGSWTTQTTNNITYAYVTVQLLPGTTLMCFGNTGGYTVAVDSITPSSSGPIYSLIATGRSPVRLYCFGARAIQNSNMGFQLFSPSGELVFDALSKWLRIAGVSGASVGSVVSPPQAVGLLAANCGVSGRQIRHNLIGGGANIVAFITINVGVNVTGSSVTVGSIVRQGPPSNPPPPQTPAPSGIQVLMVDVARY